MPCEALFQTHKHRVKLSHDFNECHGQAAANDHELPRLQVDLPYGGAHKQQDARLLHASGPPQPLHKN